MRHGNIIFFSLYTSTIFQGCSFFFRQSDKEKKMYNELKTVGHFVQHSKKIILITACTLGTDGEQMRLINSTLTFPLLFPIMTLVLEQFRTGYNAA